MHDSFPVVLGIVDLPRLGAPNHLGNTMKNANHIEVMEIAELEYDVAGVGAAEASNSEENHAAHYLVSHRLD